MHYYAYSAPLLVCCMVHVSDACVCDNETVFLSCAETTGTDGTKAKLNEESVCSSEVDTGLGE